MQSSVQRPKAAWKSSAHCGCCCHRVIIYPSGKRTGKAKK